MHKLNQDWLQKGRELGSIRILPDLFDGGSTRRLVVDDATGTAEWFDSPDAANAFALRLLGAKIESNDPSRFG